jgi:hypothetical protein
MASSQPNKTDSLTVWGGILLTLLFLNGFGAIAGGIAVMRDAMPFPEVWLQDTPFHSYFLPGLILLLAVGGSQLAASYAILRRHPLAKRAAIFAGLVLTGLDDRRTRADWPSSADSSVVRGCRCARIRVVVCTAARLPEQRGPRDGLSYGNVTGTPESVSGIQDSSAPTLANEACGLCDLRHARK